MKIFRFMAISPVRFRLPEGFRGTFSRCCRTSLKRGLTAFTGGKRCMAATVAAWRSILGPHSELRRGGISLSSYLIVVQLSEIAVQLARIIAKR
jgi:hypothetical protein